MKALVGQIGFLEGQGTSVTVAELGGVGVAVAAPRSGIGGHHSSAMRADEWLTPPHVLAALGAFDLDPCAPINRPWDMAANHFTVADNGLTRPWEGRVWMNPPYSTKETTRWLARLAEHGNGIALVFARTETEWFFESGWEKADAMLFLKGRLTFCHTDGTPTGANGGAPSVLLAYGKTNAMALRDSGLPGAWVTGWRVTS